MEPLLNGLIGAVVLVYDLIRGLLDLGATALLTGIGAGIGAYFGVRAAHTRRADASAVRG